MSRNPNPNALAFWEPYADTPGNRAWRKWRHGLEEASEGLALYRAESAADDERLLAWKAEAEAKVAEAEAKVAACEAEEARLTVAAELSHAAFERSLHALRGGMIQ